MVAVGEGTFEVVRHAAFGCCVHALLLPIAAGEVDAGQFLQSILHLRPTPASLVSCPRRGLTAACPRRGQLVQRLLRKAVGHGHPPRPLAGGVL